MKIQGSKNIFVKESQHGDRLDNEKISKRVSLSKKKSIFVGDTNFSTDNMAIKRQQAQKRALKIVMDAHKGEKRIDDDVKNRRANIEKYEDAQRFWKEEIDKTMDSINNLKGIYGITEDSQEQKDLEVLFKRADLNARKKYAPLTEKEIQFLEGTKDMDEKALTEYQSEAMKLYEMVTDRAGKEIEMAKRMALAERGSIINIENERVKSHAMVDAVKQADSIMEASHKEAVGMLMDEAKEHIEEEQEKAEKAAKEKAEKEKEEQEKIEEAREERKKREDSDILDLIGESNQAEQIQNKIQSKLKKIIMEEVVIEADLKGISVDEQC